MTRIEAEAIGAKVIALMRELAAEKARADKAEAVIALLKDRARRAYQLWDADHDMKAGKLLSAMGGVTGYDLELDEAMKERE